MAERNEQLRRLTTQWVESMHRSADETDTRAKIIENAEKLGVKAKGFRVAVTQMKMMTPGERADFNRSVDDVINANEGRTLELWPQEVEKQRRKSEREAKAAAKAAGKKPETPEQQERRLAADSKRSDPKAGGAGGVDGHGKAKDAPEKDVGNVVSKRGRGRPRKDQPNVVDLHSAAEETGEQRAALADRIASEGDKATLQPPPGGQTPPEPPATLHSVVKAGDDLIAQTAAQLEQEEGGKLLDSAIGRMQQQAAPPRAQSAIAAERAAMAGTDKPIVIAGAK